jgi:hypothetical protein
MRWLSLLFTFVFISINYISGQIVGIVPDVGEIVIINDENCFGEDDFINIDTISRQFLFLSDIAIGGNGELYVLAFVSEEHSLVGEPPNPNFSHQIIGEYDFRTGQFRDTLFYRVVSDSTRLYSLGNTGMGTLITNTEDNLALQEINPVGGTVDNIFSTVGVSPYQGYFDVVMLDSMIYAINGPLSEGKELIIFNTENTNGNLSILPADQYSIGGITILWSDDCSAKELLVFQFPFRNLRDSTFYSYELEHRSLNGELLYTTCRFFHPSESAFAPSFGLAAYDNYVNVCELQLDLDADNSGSRFGPHYWEDSRCTSSYPIADTDVTIRSLIGGVDSVTVSLRSAGSQVGVDRLLAPPNDELLVVTRGDTALTLIATSQTTNEDFADYLSSIRLEVTTNNLLEGERIVETYLYAGGVRSDQVRSFIQVKNIGNSYAGEDAELFICPGREVDLFGALGFGADPNGKWFPYLPTDGIWRDQEDPYGAYRYVVTLGDCPPDTATLVILPQFPPTSYLELFNDTVSLCTGDTVFWDVRHPQVNEVVIWDNGSNEPVRVITSPGTYRGTVFAATPCIREDIFLVVEDASISSPVSRTLTEACAGGYDSVNGW